MHKTETNMGVIGIENEIKIIVWESHWLLSGLLITAKLDGLRAFQNTIE